MYLSVLQQRILPSTTLPPPPSPDHSHHHSYHPSSTSSNTPTTISGIPPSSLTSPTYPPSLPSPQHHHTPNMMRFRSDHYQTSPHTSTSPSPSINHTPLHTPPHGSSSASMAHPPPSPSSMSLGTGMYPVPSPTSNTAASRRPPMSLTLSSSTGVGFEEEWMTDTKSPTKSRRRIPKIPYKVRTWKYTHIFNWSLSILCYVFLYTYPSTYIPYLSILPVLTFRHCLGLNLSFIFINPFILVLYWYSLSNISKLSIYTCITTNIPDIRTYIHNYIHNYIYTYWYSSF